MFTGIVEEVGTLKNIVKKSEKAWQLTIDAKEVLHDVKLGDSISVNGICLTVVDFSDKQFQVDVMPETVKTTSLVSLAHGSKVNLERAMAANGRFGGHFVSGHIDGTGKITNKKRKENAIYYDISVPNEISKFLIPKGSIAVDGTSLTIFHVANNTFRISLIPHTVKGTVLGEKTVGDLVNIECDLIVKSLYHLFKNDASNDSEKININFLQQNGFM